MLRGGASRKVGGGLSRGGRISDPWECVCVDLWEQRHGPSPLGQVPMPALCDSMAGALRALLRAPPVAAVGAEWEGDFATLRGFEPPGCSLGAGEEEEEERKANLPCLSEFRDFLGVATGARA